MNAASGARTPLSSALTATVLIIILCAAAPQLSNLPKVAAASVVLMAVRRLLEVREVIRLWRSDKRDWLVAVAVIITIITVDVGPGLAVGVALQWLMGLSRGFSLRSEVVLWQLQPTTATSESTDAAVAAATATETAPGYASQKTGVMSLPAGKTAVSAWAALTTAVADAEVDTPGTVGASSPEAAALAALASAVDGSVEGPTAAARNGALALQWLRVNDGGVATGRLSVRAGMSPTPAGTLAASAPLGTAPAVALLRFEPGLQFAEAARLSSHLEEAAACYKPLVTVLDGPRIGVMDSTGAVQLLAEGDDAVNRRVIMTLPATAAGLILAEQRRAQAAHAAQQRSRAFSASASISSVRCTPQGDAPAEEPSLDPGSGAASLAPSQAALSCASAAAITASEEGTLTLPIATGPLRVKLRSCLVVGGLNRHVLTRLLRTAAANGYRIRAVFPADAVDAPSSSAGCAQPLAQGPCATASGSSAAPVPSSTGSAGTAVFPSSPATAAATNAAPLDAEAEDEARVANVARAARGSGVLRVGQLFVTETSDGAVAFACELARLRVAAATVAESRAVAERATAALAVAQVAGATLASPSDAATATDADAFSPQAAAGAAAASIRPLAPSDASTAAVIVAGAADAHGDAALTGAGTSATGRGASASALELHDDADDAEEDRARALEGLRRRVRGIPLSSWSRAAQRNRRLHEPLVQTLLAPPQQQQPLAGAADTTFGRSAFPVAAVPAAAAGQHATAGSTDAPPLPSVRLFRKLHGAAAQIAVRRSQAARSTMVPQSAAADASATGAAATPTSGHGDAGSVSAVVLDMEAGRSAGIELAAHLRQRAGAAATATGRPGSRADHHDADRTAERDRIASTGGSCAGACAGLRPPPLSWLEAAVVADSKTAQVPSGAAGAAAAPSASRGAPSSTGQRLASWRAAVHKRATALLRAPVHAAVGAVLGLSRVAAVFGETRPFLQQG